MRMLQYFRTAYVPQARPSKHTCGHAPEDSGEERLGADSFVNMCAEVRRPSRRNPPGGTGAGGAPTPQQAEGNS